MIENQINLEKEKLHVRVDFESPVSPRIPQKY